MRLVSVVVPVYNAENYLGHCISSILGQTYKNIELILVNDGSYDNSLRICHNYAALDSRVQVINISNGGVGNARNVGLKAANGEYIMFIDSDDVISPYMVEELYQKSRLYQKDLVICGMKLVESDGRHGHRNGQYTFDSIGEEVVYDQRIFMEMLPEIFYKSALLEGPCNRIYHMNVIRENALEFPTDTEYGEDFLFNLKYYQKCNGVVLLNKSLYYYVSVKQDSLSHKYKENLFENQMRLIKAFLNLLYEEKVWEVCNQKTFYEYVASHTVKCIKMLFHENAYLDENEIKRRIAVICRERLVRESIPNSSWLTAEELNVLNKVMICDVGSVYLLAKSICTEKSTYKEEAPTGFAEVSAQIPSRDIEKTAEVLTGKAADSALQEYELECDDKECEVTASIKKTKAQIVYNCALHVVCLPLTVVQKVTSSPKINTQLELIYRVGLKKAIKEFRTNKLG